MQQAQQTDSTESSSTAELFAVDPDELDRYWKIAEPLLGPAFERSCKVDLESMRIRVAESYNVLWLLVKQDPVEFFAAMLTDIATYPTGFKTVRMLVAGGREVDRWRDGIATIEQYARDESCDAIEIFGRPGWAKYMKPHGYEETERVLQRML